MIDIGSIRDDYVPKLDVNLIGGTDEYSLVFGFRGLILAKMLDLKVMAHITDCNREELLELVGVNEKNKKNKKKIRKKIRKINKKIVINCKYS